MALVEWGEVAPDKKPFGQRSGGAGSNNKFLRIELGKTYRVRLVAKPIQFFKFYHNHGGQFRTAICENPETCTVLATHPELKPNRRYAVLVLDRDDGNKLKILEGGAAMFKGFKKFWDITKKDPGGNAGGDFIIRCTSSSGKKDRNTEYEVDYCGKASPFTPDELELFKQDQTKKEFNLKEIYAPMSDDVIEQRLFGDFPSGDRQQSVAAAAQPAVQSPKPRQPEPQPESEGDEALADFQW